MLAARGKIAWQLISASNAGQAMAAASWIAPQSIEMRMEKDRETERRIAAQLLTNDKLERALKAARTRLSDVNTALEVALGDKRVLESGQETSRLAVAENRELRLLYNRTAEELAELRRAAVGQWAQATEGHRSRRGVKTNWRWARRQVRRLPT